MRVRTAQVVGIAALALAFCGAGASGGAATSWASLPEIKLQDGTIETARHTITLDASGLPAQIVIKPDPRELPLSHRGPRAKPLPAAELREIGRGAQLRAPLRLEAAVAGKAIVAKAIERAKPTLADGVVQAASKLTAGPLAVALRLRYERDGALFGTITYGAKGAAVDAFELVADLEGRVDQVIVGAPVAGKLRAYSPAELALGTEEGLVWGNAPGDARKGGLAAPGVPRHLFVSSGDRGFTWLTDPAGGWLVDKQASTATLTRDKAGQTTWRIRFVNHRVELAKEQTVSFALLTHPATFKPAGYRCRMWLRASAEGGGDTPPLTLTSRRDAPREAAELLRADVATAFESLGNGSLLSGVAGGDALSAAQNHAETWPIGLFRYLAGTHTGLAARLRSNAVTLIRPGMSRATDRVVLARALLHDVGLDASRLAHLNDAVRVVKALHGFGLFEADGKTEFIPYWRSARFIRFGEVFKKDAAFELAEQNPLARVHVSVYVRPGRGGRARKALIVIANEGNEAVRDQLYVLDPPRLFGRANRLEHKAVISQYDFTALPDTSDWGKPGLLSRRSHRSRFVLRDLEDGGVVGQPAAKRGLETYGPRIHVPAYGFRLLYGTGAP